MKKLMKFIEAAIALTFLTMGLLLVFTNQFPNLLPLFKHVFGFILILYGAFKVYNVYNKYFIKKRNENT
jgi:hypothetical protein